MTETTNPFLKGLGVIGTSFEVDSAGNRITSDEEKKLRLMKMRQQQQLMLMQQQQQQQQQNKPSLAAQSLLQAPPQPLQHISQNLQNAQEIPAYLKAPDPIGNIFGSGNNNNIQVQSGQQQQLQALQLQQQQQQLLQQQQEQQLLKQLRQQQQQQQQLPTYTTTLRPLTHSFRPNQPGGGGNSLDLMPGGFRSVMMRDDLSFHNHQG